MQQITIQLEQPLQQLLSISKSLNGISDRINDQDIKQVALKIKSIQDALVQIVKKVQNAKQNVNSGKNDLNPRTSDFQEITTSSSQQEKKQEEYSKIFGNVKGGSRDVFYKDAKINPNDIKDNMSYFKINEQKGGKISGQRKIALTPTTDGMTTENSRQQNVKMEVNMNQHVDLNQKSEFGDQQRSSRQNKNTSEYQYEKNYQANGDAVQFDTYEQYSNKNKQNQQEKIKNVKIERNDNQKNFRGDAKEAETIEQFDNLGETSQNKSTEQSQKSFYDYGKENMKKQNYNQNRNYNSNQNYDQNYNQKHNQNYNSNQKSNYNDNDNSFEMQNVKIEQSSIQQSTEFYDQFDDDAEQIYQSYNDFLTNNTKQQKKSENASETSRQNSMNDNSDYSVRLKTELDTKKYKNSSNNKYNYQKYNQNMNDNLEISTNVKTEQNTTDLEYSAYDTYLGQNNNKKEEKDIETPPTTPAKNNKAQVKMQGLFNQEGNQMENIGLSENEFEKITKHEKKQKKQKK